MAHRGRRLSRACSTLGGRSNVLQPGGRGLRVKGRGAFCGGICGSDHSGECTGSCIVLRRFPCAAHKCASVCSHAARFAYSHVFDAGGLGTPGRGQQGTKNLASALHLHSPQLFAPPSAVGLLAWYWLSICRSSAFRCNVRIVCALGFSASVTRALLAAGNICGAIMLSRRSPSHPFVDVSSYRRLINPFL